MKFNIATISVLICSLSAAPVDNAESVQLDRRTLGLLAGLLGGGFYGGRGPVIDSGSYKANSPNTQSVNVNVNNALSNYRGNDYGQWGGSGYYPGYYSGYYPGYYPGQGQGGYPYGGPQAGYVQRSNVDVAEEGKTEEAPNA